ncbi:uncharacterized protein A4U43_C03F14010 [Asparagus officinalis]|uniref:DNA-directed RNA polymerase I subunit rpa49 n=1 Tax=Asparagus officinalis TaxID=4686 RepID=A0A5P1FBP1_ASPOF|nr:uncharacterized protein A4U43_C03F14010 [Asparagus officinalis]
MADSDLDVESNHRTKSERRRKNKRSLNVETSYLADNPDRIAPVVGYFSSGYNPCDSQEPPEVRVLRNRNHRSSRLDLVVKPKESSVEFVGRSYEGEAAVHQPCHYALGILDKDSQTLKVVPIAANKIFRLEPRVMKSPSVEEASEVLEGRVDDGNTRRKISDLTSLYGTKKQRNMDKKLRLLAQQTNDPSARENLPDEMLNVDMNDEALKDTKATIGPNIPPHDLSAVTPEKAYLLDEIIQKGERDYLFDILDLLNSGIGEKPKYWEENYYPSFVVNRIPKLKEVQNEEEKKKLAFILSYITHLVNFWKLAASNRRSKSQSSISGDAINKYKIPRIVYQKFEQLFIDPASKVLSSYKKELVIGYILVLTLFADKFSSSPSDISKDLGNLSAHTLCRQVFKQPI